MRTPKNALVKVQMLADWGDAKTGDVVEFDEVRARYLVEHGLAVEPEREREEWR